jgi:hypothetical protein
VITVSIYLFIGGFLYTKLESNTGFFIYGLQKMAFYFEVEDLFEADVADPYTVIDLVGIGLNFVNWERGTKRINLIFTYV